MCVKFFFKFVHFRKKKFFHSKISLYAGVLKKEDELLGSFFRLQNVYWMKEDELLGSFFR